MKIKFVLTLVILAMSFGIFQARPVVLADDGDTICPHTIGYWKNHEEAWPTDITFEPDTVFPYQVEGSELTYLEVLKKAKARDMTSMLAAQGIASALSVASGTDDGILETITATIEFLEEYPLGSDPQGDQRAYAEDLKNLLDDYNNSGSAGLNCAGTPDPDPGPANEPVID